MIALMVTSVSLPDAPGHELTRAVRDNPKNDAIYLEYSENKYGERQFAWRAGIAKLLPSGGWRYGDRTELLLDLAALPTTEGPVNLLPDLADGRLDLVIQDDTSVERARLNVFR